jgi:hypothetical protein
LVGWYGRCYGSIRLGCRCVVCAAIVEWEWARGMGAARLCCGLNGRRRVHGGLVRQFGNAAVWRAWVGIGSGRRCWVIRLWYRCVVCAAIVEREGARGMVVARLCCGLNGRMRVHGGPVRQFGNAAVWRAWVGIGSGRRCWAIRLWYRCVVCAAIVEREGARGMVVARLWLRGVARCGCSQHRRARVWSGDRGCWLHGDQNTDEKGDGQRLRPEGAPAAARRSRRRDPALCRGWRVEVDPAGTCVWR